MSFVMFAGCEYFGLMMGEGRSIDRDGNIISDDAEKVIRINKDVVIARAGDEFLIRAAEKPLLSIKHRKALTYEKCVSLLKSRAEELKEEYASLPAENGYKAHIGLMGISNNTLCFCSIGYYNKSVNIVECRYNKGSDVTFCFLATGSDGSLGEQFRRRFAETNVFTTDNLIAIFKSVLADNVGRDNAINERCTHKTLILRQPQ